MTGHRYDFDENRFIGKTWRTLYLNTVWPRLVWIAFALFTLIGLVLFDLWRLLPHNVAVWLLYGICFGCLLAVGLSLFRGLPNKGSVERWIRAQGGLNHQPLSALNDKPANADANELTHNLWHDYQQTIRCRLAVIDPPRFQPAFFKHDPLALRAPVILFLVAAFLASGSALLGRLSEAMNPATSGNIKAPDITAWIEGPDYLDQPDIQLIKSQGGGLLDQNSFTVTEGSQLVVFGDKAGVNVRLDGKNLKAGATLPDEGHDSFRFDLSESGQLVIASPGHDIGALKPPLGTWSLIVEQDAPPTIRFVDEPEADENGALNFSYAFSDDHGISDIHVDFNFAEPTNYYTDPLIGPPDIDFDVPETKTATDSVNVNLLRHPWAGHKVSIQLIAEDHMGQQGVSDIKYFTLPEIGFVKTLARALIDIRFQLSQSLSLRHKAAEHLGLITLWPQRINDDTAFIAMKAIKARIQNADNHLKRAGYYAQMLGAEAEPAIELIQYAHQELVSSLDFLFEVALAVDGQTIESAREAMETAFKNLEKAISRNAGNETVNAHIEDLREAVARYLKALTVMTPEEMLSGGGAGGERSLTELEEALSVLGQLNDLNERDAARAVLRQLQSMINNIDRVVVSEGQPNPEQEALDELGQLLGDLRELNDQTKDETEAQDGNESASGQPSQGESKNSGDQAGSNSSGNSGETQRQGEAQAPGQDNHQKTLPEKSKPSLRSLMQAQNKLNEALNNFMEQLDEQGLLSDGGTNTDNDSQSKPADSSENGAGKQGEQQANNGGLSDEPTEQSRRGTSGEGQANNDGSQIDSGRQALSQQLKSALDKALRALNRADTDAAFSAQQEAIDTLRALSERLAERRANASQGTGTENPFGGDGEYLGSEGDVLPTETLKNRLVDLLNRLRRQLDDKKNPIEFQKYLERLIR